MRARLTGALAAFGVAGVIAAATIATADAATVPSGTQGVFSISPGDHELFAAPGSLLSPTLVRNTTRLSLAVSATPVLLSQSSSGAFQFGATAADQAAARRALAVSTRGLTMGPRSTTTVLERWLPTAGHHPLYAAVVFRATPLGHTTGVRVIDQLLGVDLLGLRGAPPARGRITALSIADATAHRLRAIVSLRNVGRSFGTPSRLEVLVRDASGHVVTRVGLTPGVILPGVTRDFVAALPRRLAPGLYSATAVATLHGRVRGVVQRFSVVAGGLLPAPSLVPGTVATTGTVGGSAHVTVTLHNEGTRAGAPNGSVSLYPIHDGVAATTAAATTALAGGSIAPGATTTEHLTVGRLRRGPYDTVVRYADPVTPTPPTLVNFTPRPAMSVWVATTGWADRNVALIAMGALLAIAVGYLGRRVRRAESRPRPGIRLRPLP